MLSYKFFLKYENFSPSMVVWMVTVCKSVPYHFITTTRKNWPWGRFREKIHGKIKLGGGGNSAPTPGRLV